MDMTKEKQESVMKLIQESGTLEDYNEVSIDTEEEKSKN